MEKKMKNLVHKIMIIIFLILSVGGCTGGNFHYFPSKIYIDPNFTVQEQALIIQSLDEWKEKTGGIADEEPVIGYRTDRSFDTKQHEILKKYSTDPKIKREVSRNGTFNGCTHTETFWGNKDSDGSIWIVTDVIERTTVYKEGTTEKAQASYEQKFLHVVTHELGHHYGLKHTNQTTKSIMVPTISTKTHLAHSDVARFCELYNCN